MTHPPASLSLPPTKEAFRVDVRSRIRPLFCCAEVTSAATAMSSSVVNSSSSSPSPPLSVLGRRPILPCRVEGRGKTCTGRRTWPGGGGGGGLPQLCSDAVADDDDEETLCLIDSTSASVFRQTFPSSSCLVNQVGQAAMVLSLRAGTQREREPLEPSFFRSGLPQLRKRRGVQPKRKSKGGREKGLLTRQGMVPMEE